MVDNNQTPHLVVDANQPEVVVPDQHVEDGKIILNVSYSATRRLELGNDVITFEARFGGVPRQVQVPLKAVLGIYSRETGEGLVFPVDEYEPATAAGAPAAGPAGPDSPPPDKPSPPPGRPSLKIVK